MKQLKIALLTFALLFGVVSVFTPEPAAAIKVFQGCSGGVVCNDTKGAQSKVSGFFRNLINVFLFVLGAIAVIMIIIGGIRYTTSAGNTNAVTEAKNTILYAVIGLVVAILAFPIVNFVINAFK